ncbi:MAG: DUF4397 domain-containing protein, partial [Ornithinimicrobium sp.]|uniref:DUF4397 domain-containing protein n=1 Tax=Ornithinimicrobium sp. TaxID=1977084 RepID=UPI003D9BEF0B
QTVGIVNVQENVVDTVVASRRRIWVRAALALGSAALVVSGMLAPAATAAEEAVVYVVQGLPDEVVDVAVDGETVASEVETAEVVGPFSVSAGSIEVSFTDADGAVIADNTVTTKADSSSDLVVHLPTSAAQEPVLTVFDNDLSPVPATKAAVSVAHAAAVPPTDILVDGEVLFANVANGESLDLVVPVGTYEVQCVPTGETEPLIFGPMDLSLTGGALTRVYSVGDAQAETASVAMHVIDVADTGSSQPTMVNTGTGGQLAMLMRLRGILAALVQ